MKTNKLSDQYKEEYENKFIAVNMTTGSIFDFDYSFITMYEEIPKEIRKRLFFYYCKNKEFSMIKTKE